jgi:hypothetical protein
VKFHTVFDLVEACFESTSFPNFKALRSALERLLANMGIKTVRHMCELPLVDSQEKRDEIMRMLVNKSRFAKQCKARGWLGDDDVALLFPAMGAVTEAWEEAVEGTLRSDKHWDECIVLILAACPTSCGRSLSSSRESSVDLDAGAGFEPQASCPSRRQVPAPAPHPPPTPASSAVPPSLPATPHVSASDGHVQADGVRPAFPNPRAASLPREVVTAVLEHLPDGLVYRSSGPRYVSNADEAEQHPPADGVSYVSAMRQV